jgi:biopolymer transport protein ExbD
VPYGEVVELMNDVKAAGTGRVGLMVKGQGQGK